MAKCNQLCQWNYYEVGCAKPFYEVCPLVSALANAGVAKDKPMTNADRIRAMTDEELADLFRYRGCPPDRLTGKCVKVGVCEACWVDWLKQPVGEVV